MKIGCGPWTGEEEVIGWVWAVNAIPVIGKCYWLVTGAGGGLVSQVWGRRERMERKNEQRICMKMLSQNP